MSVPWRPNMPRLPQKQAAIIAGAGAVVGAWKPVLKALQPYHDFPLTPDGANSFLARVVYLLRWFAALDTDFGRDQFRRSLEIMNAIKASIAKELRTAEEHAEITPRPNLNLVLQKLLIPYSQSFMLVTTNWDSVIGKSIHRILNVDHHVQLHPLHIHGSTADPATVYLPSEVTNEPYRTPKERKAIGSLHGSIWRGLEKARRVIVYGLSIDPLDAELGQTLASGWSNPNLEEIFIIDPNHKPVAHRVNLLLDRRRDVRVIGLHPDTLAEEADYTIWRHDKSRAPTEIPKSES